MRSIDARASGMPIIDAQDEFRRARRAHAAARLWRHLSRRKRSPRGPRTLSDVDPLPAGPRRLEFVPLRSIIGTFALTVEFDARFRPASERTDTLGAGYARAPSRVALPPVVLIQRPDGYYVVDGRHRVSVALALDHSNIDAWVIGPTSGLGGSASIDTALAAWLRLELRCAAKCVAVTGIRAEPNRREPEICDHVRVHFTLLDERQTLRGSAWWSRVHLRLRGPGGRLRQQRCISPQSRTTGDKRSPPAQAEVSRPRSQRPDTSALERGCRNIERQDPDVGDEVPAFLLSKVRSHFRSEIGSISGNAAHYL